MMRCAVCGGEPARKRRGLKRILCDECARAAYRNEGYRRELVLSSSENYLKTHGHLPQDGGMDTFEGQSRRTME